MPNQVQDRIFTGSAEDAKSWSGVVISTFGDLPVVAASHGASWRIRCARDCVLKASCRTRRWRFMRRSCARVRFIKKDWTMPPRRSRRRWQLTTAKCS